MNNRTSDPVFMRNVLLTALVLLLLLALALSHGAIASYAMSPFGPLVALYPAGLALVIAKSFGLFAVHILRGPGSTWYVRPGAIAFLVVLVPCWCAVFIAVVRAFRFFVQLHPAIPTSARIAEFVSLLLLWIVMLDRPVQGFSTPTRPNHRFKAGHEDHDDYDSTCGGNSGPQDLSRRP
jgi:hypothetical protein